MNGYSKYQNLEKMEEEILRRAIKRGLTTEKQLSPWNYRVTMAETRELNTRKEYIEMVITIDQCPIEVYTHKDIRRATLHYCYFDGEDTFDNGEKITYQLYLNADDILDGNPLFTTTKEERRKFKLKKIKNIILDNQQLEK